MRACAIFFDEPLSYRDGLLLQEGILEAREKDLLPDTVLFLEHQPVITCGVRSKPEQVLLSTDELKAKHIEILKTSRGGAVTFHGPGQLIIYPVIRLGGNRTDVHGYLHNLEEVAIRTAAGFGVTAYRRKGMTGAWTDHGKLAAIGVRFKRWITYHGMSFNVHPDLSGFSAIIPCGLAGEKVASLKISLADKCPALEKVRDFMADQFRAVFGRELAVLRERHFLSAQLAALISRVAS